MAEAFNIKPFGFNVMPQGKQNENQLEKSVEKAIGSLWEPVLSYLKDNENVFNGSVIDEINKTNIETMKLGTIMSAGQNAKNLDVTS